MRLHLCVPKQVFGRTGHGAYPGPTPPTTPRPFGLNLSKPGHGEHQPFDRIRPNGEVALTILSAPCRLLP